VKRAVGTHVSRAVRPPLWTAWIAIVIALGCASPAPPPPADDWLPDDTHTGVEAPELQRLLDEHWAWTLEEHPVFATRIGVRRFDDRLGDGSHDAVLAARERKRGFAERARAILERPRLSAADATTAEIFASGLENELAASICELHLWSVDPHIGNVLTRFNDLPTLHSVATPEDGAHLIARYRAIPAAIDQRIANLRLGLERGYVANATAVGLLADLIEAELAEPGSPLLAPAEAERPDWPTDAAAAFTSDLRAAVEDAVEPALAGYAQFLRTELLPRARGPEAEGVDAIPNGDACYAALVRLQTTLPMEGARELHQRGLDEVSWLDAEMLAIGEETLGETEIPALMWRLRLDPNLQFAPDGEHAGEAEILATSRSALERAREALPAWFGALPEAPVEVVPVPAYRAPATPAGYYSMSGPRDARIGRFYVNTWRPETRPRFGLETLTFHESIPGHHLQIALAQELGDLPAFRKYFVSVAFSEGWALYAERLADEMGLLSGPLDRLGRLNAEAWRAARLVVDTGLHALGWTRQDAVEFMLGHTALPQHEIETEVGRYLTNPGQALGYKAGQLEILRLRKEARSKLGDRFDIRGFHDAVLLGGGVPLPVLQQRVEQWVAAQTR
jgi:uncharacterized protein (DUF885 family)